MSTIITAVVPATRKEFKPLVGHKASIKLESGIYYDCTVMEFVRGGRIAKVKIDVDGSEYNTPVSLLEKPLASDVNERFEYFRDLSVLVMHKKLKSLFVTGEGGIGKTFTIDEMLAVENLKEDTDYIRIKGYTTARALYSTLREHSEKLLIFDDCDSALTDPTAQNILKAVLDTYSRRRVQWMAHKANESFDFHGSVIFLSNKNKDKVSQAIISRSVIIDLFMSPEEKITRMEYLLPSLDVGKSLSDEEKMEVLRLIDKFKYTIGDLNLRTLIKSLVVFENTRDLEITRYQIING